MAQLTIYLPDEIAKQVRQDARRAKKSVSAYLADLAVKRGARLEDAAWKRALLATHGSWVGPFPELEDAPPDEPDAL